MVRLQWRERLHQIAFQVLLSVNWKGLTGCSNTSVNGSYVAHEEGSNFLFTFPSSTGTLVSIKFKAGSISTYNGEVSAAKLLARQGNGLATYASNYQPEQTYFAPTLKINDLEVHSLQMGPQPGRLEARYS